MKLPDKVMNCIVVFNKDKDKVLFCKRKKEPFKDRLNFVGGKVELGETSEAAAYRELQEETGISRRQIRLFRLMDLTYFYQDFILEIYVGRLSENVVLKEETNPLLWLSLEEDFAVRERFAGEQNIAHIINIALLYPLPDKTFLQDGLYIGVDGCKGGWIAAILDHCDLQIEKYDNIEALIGTYPKFDSFLIDMAIGLRDRADQLRPDNEARAELKSKASSVFPVPCREAVYAEGEKAQKEANQRILGKSLAKQSIAIIPKIKELDVFLERHPEYKNVILESHPELAFARMKGSELMTRKKEYTGYTERKTLLEEYLDKSQLTGLRDKAKQLGCAPDDVLDAICMAVTAAMQAHGMCETIPSGPGKPEKDSRELRMQMIVPK